MYLSKMQAVVPVKSKKEKKEKSQSRKRFVDTSLEDHSDAMKM